jgi:hypothetical protein
MPAELKELKVNEVSLVDKPACASTKNGKKVPHAIVALWKRDGELDFEAVLKAAKGIKFVLGFPKGGGASKVQSVIFDKEFWTEAEARKWLTDNDFKSGKIDDTEGSLRFRQEDPEGFERFRTITPGQTNKGDDEMALTLKEIEDKVLKQDTEIATLKAEREALVKENEAVLKMTKPQMAAYASMDAETRKAYLAADDTKKKELLDAATARKREADLIGKMDSIMKAQFDAAGPVEKAALLETVAKAEEEKEKAAKVKAEKEKNESEDEGEVKEKRTKSKAEGDCDMCNGTGKIFGKKCGNCDGTGKAQEADVKEEDTRKRDEEILVAKREKAQVQDRLTKAEAELASIRKRDRLVTFAKRAEDELPHTAGTAEEKGEMLMKMADAFGEDSDTFKKFFNQLKTADSAIAPRFGEVGRPGGPIKGEKALEARVNEIAKRDKISVAKAWTRVPEECPDLWMEYELDRRQVAARQ